MTQASRPQADSAPTYPDAGPYSRDQWAERIYAVYTGDENTAGQRTKLRGVVPTFDNMLVVTNPAGVTIRVGTGAGISGGSFLFNSAAVDFTPTTPIADRIDRVVVVENNTNAAYNTGLEFPTVLTDYGGATSVPAYSARLAILIGTPGGAATALVQTTNYWMVQLAEYTISNVPAVSGLTDSREFMDIETVVSTVAAENTAIHDAAVLGVEVNDGVGAADLGVGIKFRLENSAGTAEDAGQLAVRYTDAAAADETRLELRLKSGGSDNLSAVINAPSTASADGNARGAGAVDLQQNRSAVTQVASGDYSFLSGYRNTASGDNTFSTGSSNTSSGANSSTEGVGNVASGIYAHAEGHSTVASDDSAHAEGFATSASGAYAHAEGWSTEATNQSAHAEGTDCVASGSASHAEGAFTTASGIQSHAECYNTTASGDYSHAAGRSSLADLYAQYVHASGGFAVLGDAQGTIQMVARGTTAGGGVAIELFLDGAGASQRMVIPASSAWAVDVLLIAVAQNAADAASFHGYCMIYRDNAGNTSVTGAAVTAIVASGCNMILTADDPNNSLLIQFSDDSAHVFRAVATVRLAQVTFP